MVLQGAESNLPEVVCQGSTHAITSGGGFSTYYVQPSFQTSAVAAYFLAASSIGHTPFIG